MVGILVDTVQKMMDIEKSAILPAPAQNTQDMVSGGINVTNLDTVAGDSYTDRSWMPTTDWMASLLGD